MNDLKMVRANLTRLLSPNAEIFQTRAATIMAAHHALTTGVQTCIGVAARLAQA